MRPRQFLLLGFLLGPAVHLPAQSTIGGPGGVVRGVVRDSATGGPVGYALIKAGPRNQVFAGEDGRFVLRGIPAGRLSLRVQQIGYRARVIQVTVGTGSPAAELIVTLTRQALVLPEIRVRAEACQGMAAAGTGVPEAGTILDEAFRNAERIEALEKRYPVVLAYLLITTILDSNHARVGVQVDTIHRDSRKFAPYRAGQLVDRLGTRLEKVSAFTTASVAGAEFQRNHCFWFTGRDSVGTFSGFRIDFAPRPGLKSLDWEGSFLVDSASMSLLKAEARVVNIPRRSRFFSVGCSIFYQPILPSLPQETEARCISELRGPPRQYLVEHWRLVDRAFQVRVPGAPEPLQRR